MPVEQQPITVPPYLLERSRAARARAEANMGAKVETPEFSSDEVFVDEDVQEDQVENNSTHTEEETVDSLKEKQPGRQDLDQWVGYSPRQVPKAGEGYVPLDVTGRNWQKYRDATNLEHLVELRDQIDRAFEKASQDITRDSARLEFMRSKNVDGKGLHIATGNGLTKAEKAEIIDGMIDEYLKTGFGEDLAGVTEEIRDNIRQVMNFSTAELDQMLSKELAKKPQNESKLAEKQTSPKVKPAEAVPDQPEAAEAQKELSPLERLRNEEGLAPAVELDINGKHFGVSKIYNTITYGKAVLHTVDTEGNPVMHMLYKSNSDGGWRVTPGIAQSGRFVKGSERHYTQETKLHPDILQALEEVETVMGTGEVLRLGSLIEDAFTMSEREAIENFAREITFDDLRLAGIDSSQLPRPGYLTPDRGMPSEKLYAMLGKVNEALSGESADVMPDFDAGPTSVINREHTLLGPVTYTQFAAKINDRDAYWEFGQDAEGRTWVDRIAYTDSDVTTYGTDKELIDSAFITSKPLDYARQVTAIHGEDQAAFTPDSRYRDITPFLAQLEPIKQFKEYEARAAQEQAFQSMLTPDAIANLYSEIDHLYENDAGEYGDLHPIFEDIRTLTPVDNEGKIDPARLKRVDPQPNDELRLRQISEEVIRERIEKLILSKLGEDAVTPINISRVRQALATYEEETFGEPYYFNLSEFEAGLESAKTHQEEGILHPKKMLELQAELERQRDVEFERLKQSKGEGFDEENLSAAEAKAWKAEKDALVRNLRDYLVRLYLVDQLEGSGEPVTDELVSRVITQMAREDYVLESNAEELEKGNLSYSKQDAKKAARKTSKKTSKREFAGNQYIAGLDREKLDAAFASDALLELGSNIGDAVRTQLENVKGKERAERRSAIDQSMKREYLASRVGIDDASSIPNWLIDRVTYEIEAAQRVKRKEQKQQKKAKATKAEKTEAAPSQEARIEDFSKEWLDWAVSPEVLAYLSDTIGSQIASLPAELAGKDRFSAQDEIREQVISSYLSESNTDANKAAEIPKWLVDRVRQEVNKYYEAQRNKRRNGNA